MNLSPSDFAGPERLGIDAGVLERAKVQRFTLAEAALMLASVARGAH